MSQPPPPASEPASEPAPEPVHTPEPGAVPRPGSATPPGTPVRVRRAPRYRAFVLTGLVAALVVAAVTALATEPSGGYSRAALFGYLAVVLGLVGAVGGGLVAVLLERRR